MRRTTVAAGWVLLAALVAGPAAPARAACAAPVLRTEPAVATPGGPLLVTGEHFAAECRDVFVGDEPATPAPPSRDVVLVLVTADGVAHRLAEVDAEEDYRLRAEVVVPAAATGGPARVTATPPGGGTYEVALAVAGDVVVPAGPAPGGELPHTGTDDGLLLGLGFVLAGLLALGAERYSAARSGRRSAPVGGSRCSGR